MSSAPLVSIVIPVYNGANYVGDAVESALAQTYPETEVLVIDDGSSDGGATRAVVESFGDRVRYFWKPNGGVATALNLGIAQMRGQLFSWLSHDDLYKPHKVERQVETWRRFGHRCVVIGDFELMDADGNTMGRSSLAAHNLIARPLDAVFRGLINGCALLIPRDVFDEAGLFEPGLPTTQDYHLWYRVARLVPFVHCAQADVRQRVHALQGSRHASHLDEASRMFAYLVDMTPPSLMRAYDGSELRFLLRTRQVLTSYPGLQAYLSYRIRQLLQQVPYSLVLWGADASVETASAELGIPTLPPAQILAIQPGGSAAALPGQFAAAGTHPADIVEAAYAAVTTGIILFVRAPRLPSEGQVRAALEDFITADADAAVPQSVPETLAEIDGLIARHDALPTLATELRRTSLRNQEMQTRLQLHEYTSVDLIRIESPEDITAALKGRSIISYHDGLSESAIVNLVTAGHDRRLPTILFFQHALGGGAQVHMNLLIRELAGKANFIVVYGTRDRLRLSINSENPRAGLVFHVPGDFEVLARILRLTGVTRADVHHTMSFETEVEMLLDILQIPFDITLVDYHLIAESPFLCSQDGRFEGEEQLRGPESSVLRHPPAPILEKASRVLGISRDLAARFERLHGKVPVIPVRLWHEERPRIQHVFPPRLWGNEALRIVIAGDIQPHKGSEVIFHVAREAAERNLPLQFHVMGDLHASDRTRGEISDGLTLHGRYPAGGFSVMLGQIAPHVAWIPAQVPETWSYVLSELFSAALPIAASAIGAIPERCHGRPFTWLLPWDTPAEDWLELFLRLHATKLQEPARWTDVDHLPKTRHFYFEEYLHPQHSLSGPTG